MKKKVVLGLIVSALTTSLFTVCGTATTNLSESTEETVSVAETQSSEPTEAPHEHSYTEAVTTEASCETDGVKTFSCECGDSYTEAIPAMGHSFTSYVYNEDAT